MVIDIHTHAFPDRICARTIQILERNILTHSHKEYKACGDGSVGGLAASGKAAGIDVSVIMPIATSPKQTEKINAFAAENCRREGILSFGSLYPFDEDYERTLENIKELDLPGIKLHPEYQGFFVDCPEIRRIVKKCEELGLLVMLHSGDDHGAPPPIHCTPERLANLLDYVSGSNIIAAHMGGWNIWDDVERYIIGKPIYIDTSFSLHLLDGERAAKMIRNHGVRRVLEGSDWPWYSQAQSLAMVRALPLDEEEKALICGGNSARILGLEK